MAVMEFDGEWDRPLLHPDFQALLDGLTDEERAGARIVVEHMAKGDAPVAHGKVARLTTGPDGFIQLI